MHPFSTVYPCLGHGGGSLSKEDQTFLTLATSSSSSGGTLSQSQGLLQVGLPGTPHQGGVQDGECGGTATSWLSSSHYLYGRAQHPSKKLLSATCIHDLITMTIGESRDVLTGKSAAPFLYSVLSSPQLIRTASTSIIYHLNLTKQFHLHKSTQLVAAKTTQTSQQDMIQSILAWPPLNILHGLKASFWRRPQSC